MDVPSAVTRVERKSRPSQLTALEHIRTATSFTRLPTVIATTLTSSAKVTRCCAVMSCALRTLKMTMATIAAQPSRRHRAARISE